MTTRPPDCDLSFLPPAQAAALGGFTSRAFRALGHLREAWCVADDSNARAIESAIRDLLTGHSFRDHQALVTQILIYGLASDQAPLLLRAVGLDRRSRR